jgi:ABC-type multidrug transport system fused ATPase/permease subunit
MMEIVTLLAQIAPPPEASAEAGLVGSEIISDAIAKSLDSLWKAALTGPLYQSINNVGVLLAVFCIGFWCFKFYREMEEGGLRPAASELIFPIILVFLLSNGGSNLSNCTMGMRDYMNKVNTQLISNVGTTLNFQKALDNLSAYASSEQKIAELRARCDGITNNEKLELCLEESREMANALIEQYKALSPPESWLDALQKDLEDAFSAPGKVISTIKRVALSPILVAVQAFMAAMQGAFQYAIEISMLLTALFAPIALGLSLLPFGAKPIYAWISGFISLGLCKTSLNIIAGLVATASQDVGPDGGSLVTAIAIGLLSPILALGLSTGGGMAIFSGICAAASSAVSMGVSAVTAGIVKT